MKGARTPGSQNCKTGLGRISKMSAFTNNSQTQQNQLPLQNHWIFLAKFWHGISMKHRFSDSKNEKKICSVVFVTVNNFLFTSVILLHFV